VIDPFMAYDASDPLNSIPRLLDEIKEGISDMRSILYGIQELLLGIVVIEESLDDDEGETEAE
jgi:hypothetical protein